LKEGSRSTGRKGEEMAGREAGGWEMGWNVGWKEVSR